mmetsp:Transcript_59998/g.119054  ORF Transcript_59998/g.119054 Transcript_59998/m.119054 type:complete len:380 (+) Transcript_59998:172-1311(+)
MPAEAPIKTKVLAGAGLVCVQVLVGTLYKVSQKTGGFAFSTTSAIAMAEMAKLMLSLSFHFSDKSHHEEGTSKLKTGWVVARDSISKGAVFHILVLSFLYTLNNQVNFYLYKLVDPGTIYLFKTASTIIVATTQCLCVGKRFSGEQWKAMYLQGMGMVIVQYDSCKGAGLYAPFAYVLLGMTIVMTATCAVRNEYLVKNYSVPLHIQNAVLYLGGSLMNIAAFLFLPNPNSKQANIGFFEGYDNPLAIGVVAINAVIGIAITMVYKYADAITKCIAGDLTAVILCIVSSFFFHLKTSLTTWCGVQVVCFAVHLYLSAPPAAPLAALSAKAPAPPVTATPGQQNAYTLTNVDSNEDGLQDLAKPVGKAIHEFDEEGPDKS